MAPLSQVISVAPTRKHSIADTEVPPVMRRISDLLQPYRSTGVALSVFALGDL